MDLTDKQVLTQLRLKKLRLTLELERVEIAIKAFEGVDVNSLNEFDLLAYDTDIDTAVADDLKSDVRYSSDMNNESKILWALSKLKEGTAIEISDYLMHTDSTLTHRTRVINAITYSASRMFKADKIAANKVGTKNIYSLKI
jgi:hypothetical protein